MSNTNFSEPNAGACFLHPLVLSVASEEVYLSAGRCICGAHDEPDKKASICWWCGKKILKPVVDSEKEPLTYEKLTNSWELRGCKGKKLECILLGSFWEDDECMKVFNFIRKVYCLSNDVTFRLVVSSGDKPNEAPPRIHLRQIDAKAQSLKQSPSPSQIQGLENQNPFPDSPLGKTELRNICIQISAACESLSVDVASGSGSVLGRTVATLTKVFVCSCFALYPTFSVSSPDFLRLLPLFVRVPADTGVKHTKMSGLPRNRAQNKQAHPFLSLKE